MGAPAGRPRGRRLAARLRRRAHVPRRRRQPRPRLPESRRYELPHAERPPLPRRRFVLLGVSAFLYNILIAPTTFYENRYLKDVRGYSASLIALYTLVTATPGAIGVLVGGRLADVKGRRLVGAVALLAVAIGNICVFSFAGRGCGRPSC